MKRVTIDDILAVGCCYSRAYLQKLFGRKKYATAADIFDCEAVPIKDRLWVFFRTGLFLTRGQKRLLAADYAEHVLPIWTKRYPEDARPRKAIDAARQKARDEMQSTAGAAYDATVAAAGADAAAYAADDAAATAAAAAAAGAAAAAAYTEDGAVAAAAYAVADDAAAAAADDYDYAAAVAERKWQLAHLREYLLQGD